MSEMKDWTIMVYMSGDNNLSVDMAYALENIKKVAGSSSKKVNILVYFDGYSRSIPTLYCDLSDPENPVYIPSNKVENKLLDVKEKFNEDSASPDSVLNFVDWCLNKENRKANKYGLIFSGHSFGFQSIGLLKDESSGHSLSMDKVHSLLRKIKDEITGKKLEILGFDSCVMSMLEVGYQFKDVAETLIASEGSVPRAGWAYTEILGHLAHSDSHDSIKDIAEDFVRTYITKEGKYTLSDTSVDMAAWDLSKIADLNAPFEKLSELLIKCFDDENTTIYRQMKRVLLQIHKECQSYMYEQNIDLGDFCELLKQEVSSLKEKELGTNFHTQINSLYDILNSRKDLNEDVHRDLDTIKNLSEELHNKLQSTLNNLSARGDISRDLKNKMDSIEYLNSDLDNLLNSIIEACDEVLAAIRECVILAGFSGGQYQFSNGISLFFPWSLSAYDVAKKDYEKLDFVSEKDGGISWNKFLKKYLGEVTFRESINKQENNKHLVTNPFHWANTVHGESVNCQVSEVKMTHSADNKLTHSPDNKLTHSPDNKLTHSPDNKLTHSPDNKLTHSPDNKLTHSPDNKLTHSPDNKLTHSPDNKLGGGGGTGHYLELFRQYSNTETPWNISGFTVNAEAKSEVAEEFAEKKKTQNG